jgi:poly(hydroxyalkanoate) depolymerase family esterase
MAGLGETTAFLKSMKRFADAAGGLTAEARCVETLDFGDNPGALRMLSYVPEGLKSGAPLVVTLHGCTQQGEAYAASAGWLDLADQYGFAVLAPEQTQLNNPNRCFNWFSPEDHKRGKGEAASVAAMIATLIAAHGLDADRVYVTGLSAGGAMTAAMLAAYPELFAGGAVIAGLPYGVAVTIPDAMRVMHGGDGRGGKALGDLVRKASATRDKPLRLSIWHGDGDLTVNHANARDLVQQWSSVLGLKGAGKTDATSLRTRQTWEAASSLELVLVHGLGHGTPLSAANDDALGSTAPFMLEAGISSTREIAAFWGLQPAPGHVAPQPKPKAAPRPKARPAASAKPEPEPAPPLSAPVGLAAKIMDSVSRHTSPDVQSVIAKALRSAGLMK